MLFALAEKIRGVVSPDVSGGTVFVGDDSRESGVGGVDGGGSRRPWVGDTGADLHKEENK